MTPTAVRLSWGDALYAKTRYRPGGLKAITEIARSALGPRIGVRNTFAKLYELEDAPADADDTLRAWIVLTALGEDPSSWGVHEDALPGAYDLSMLRDLLILRSPYIDRTAA